MDIKKTALVTALFDIGRDKWDNFTMSYHTYIWWMRSLLYLDTNLIIYTEEKFKDQIMEFRKTAIFLLIFGPKQHFLPLIIIEYEMHL